MTKIIALTNQKGGVGKTTSSVNIAASLAVSEFNTLLLDMDPQANATSGVGIEVGSYEISIYDLSGRLVKVIEKTNKSSGKNLVIWNGVDSRKDTRAYLFKIITNIF